MGVIGKAMRGRQVPGLLRYLYGPGKANEHEDPRLVAGWDADLGALEPVVGESGRRDFRRLTALLEQMPLVAGMSGEDRPVYHLVMRAAPGTRSFRTRTGVRLPRT